MGPVSVPLPQEAVQDAGEPIQLGDRVDLSSSQELRQLNEAVKALPSVRAEKVEGLRGAIEEGSYHVETEKLARKVVDEALSEALLKQVRERQAR
jgi:flagellar biosynthesis anti-sigma factor FlgM